MLKKELIAKYGGNPSDWKRHKNPDGSKGGWVSECSSVSEDSYISEDSIVMQNSIVRDNSTICNSYVYNNSTVRNSTIYNSTVRNYSTVDNSTVDGINLVSIQGTQHSVCWYDGDRIKIGCEVHTLAHWLEHYAEIGRKNGYPPPNKSKSTNVT